MSEPLPTKGLDDLCGACNRISGDHTLREWASCTGSAAHVLEYSDDPGTKAQELMARLREQFKLDADMMIADTITAASMVLSGRWGAMDVVTPALLHDFQMGSPSGPLPVCRVLYVGPPDPMRAYGRLIRDTANGAVNGAERATRGPGGSGFGGGKRR